MNEEKVETNLDNEEIMSQCAEGLEGPNIKDTGDDYVTLQDMEQSFKEWKVPEWQDCELDVDLNDVELLAEDHQENIKIYPGAKEYVELVKSEELVHCRCRSAPCICNSLDTKPNKNHKIAMMLQGLITSGKIDADEIYSIGLDEDIVLYWEQNFKEHLPKPWHEKYLNKFKSYWALFLTTWVMIKLFAMYDKYKLKRLQKDINNIGGEYTSYASGTTQTIYGIKNKSNTAYHGKRGNENFVKPTDAGL